MSPLDKLITKLMKGLQQNICGEFESELTISASAPPMLPLKYSSSMTTPAEFCPFEIASVNGQLGSLSQLDILTETPLKLVTD